MARGTTLTRLLDMYRAECRLSLNVAHNVQQRDQQVAHLQRTQEWLWDDCDWPTLRVERKFNLQAGQQYYAMPNDMRISRIQKIEVFQNAAYYPLHAGLDAVHYTIYNSELDQRQWPPQRWRISEDEQIEIWPIPDQNADTTTLEGTVKITGIRNLRPLVDGDDVADLDDRLIVLFCASEALASQGAKDAVDKRNMANARYMKLRGQQMPSKTFNMFDADKSTRRFDRVPIAVYTRSS